MRFWSNKLLTSLSLFSFLIFAQVFAGNCKLAIELQNQPHLLAFALENYDEINRILFIKPLSNDEDEIFQTELMNKAVGSGGKRVRPMMALLMAKISGGRHTLNHLLRAIEFLHTASLVKDDLPSQDNADFRRGQPTLHKLYGVDNAELTVDRLVAKAFREISLLSEDFPAERVLKLSGYIARVYEKLALGQRKDLKAAPDQTEEQIKENIYLKTGVVFEASLISVLILNGYDESDELQIVRSMKSYARNLGIAFQVRDDLIDLLPTTGKTPGQDKKLNRVTYLSRFGEEAAKRLLARASAAAHLDADGPDVAHLVLQQIVDYNLQRMK